MLIISDDGAPIYEQICNQFRGAIASGGLAAGSRLPSIRKLQNDLGVSHTTVERAYLQLTTEGYIRNVPRSGYIVEDIDSDFLLMASQPRKEQVASIVGARNRDAFYAETARASGARYDFSYANLPPDSFPVREWRKLTGDVLYSSRIPALARYAYVDDVSPLSEQLASYLQRARGMSCDPAQIIPLPGTDGALATILQLFSEQRCLIGMEEPGYGTVREVAHRMGFELTALPTMHGADAFLEAVRSCGAGLVFCTPSHQFPTGMMLPIEARIELLKLAEENDFYIVEDDSCNEYRYDTSPVPALASLDPYGRVIYLGNVSKVLSPALRIAYVALPPELLKRYLALFNYAHPAISWLDQEVLARFMEQGYWDRHIRQMSTALKKRHDELLRCLESAFGETIELRGVQSGMHLFATVDNGMSQDELVSAALAEGANVYGTRRMWFSRPAPESHLMIGFSSINVEDIEPGVEALRRAWF